MFSLSFGKGTLKLKKNQNSWLSFIGFSLMRHYFTAHSVNLFSLDNRWFSRRACACNTRNPIQRERMLASIDLLLI